MSTNVNESVWDYVWDSVWDSVWQSVEESVRKSVGKSVEVRYVRNKQKKAIRHKWLKPEKQH